MHETCSYTRCLWNYQLVKNPSSWCIVKYCAEICDTYITKYNSNQTTTHGDWNSHVQKPTNTLGKTTHGDGISSLKMHSCWLCIRNHNYQMQHFWCVKNDLFLMCENPFMHWKTTTHMDGISNVKTHSCTGKMTYGGRISNIKKTEFTPFTPTHWKNHDSPICTSFLNLTCAPFTWGWSTVIKHK